MSVWNILKIRRDILVLHISTESAEWNVTVCVKLCSNSQNPEQNISTDTHTDISSSGHSSGSFSHTINHLLIEAKNIDHGPAHRFRHAAIAGWYMDLF